MAERKFQVIQERPVGHLSKEFREKWDRLNRRAQRLQAAQERLEAAYQRFMHQYADKVRIKDPGERKAYRGFRLDDDGVVWRQFCLCPACQAVLHGMSVTDTVEEMIREDLIEHSAIAEVRKQALELDAKERDAIKLKLLVN